MSTTLSRMPTSLKIVGGFDVVMGRILAFSIDLLRRHYNTITLPYECVMFIDIQSND